MLCPDAAKVRRGKGRGKCLQGISVSPNFRRESEMPAWPLKFHALNTRRTDPIETLFAGPISEMPSVPCPSEVSANDALDAQSAINLVLCHSCSMNH